MARSFFVSSSVILTVLVFISCAAGNSYSPQTDSPIDPGLSLQQQSNVNLSDQRCAEQVESCRYLWSYHLIHIDPTTLHFDVYPLRDAAIHWNVLSWLEQFPCSNCFELAGIVPSGTGTLLVSIRITHPYLYPNLTGFDVRGIAMFNASRVFPASGLTFSDGTMGDIVVVNPDGYTTLYNPTTTGGGPGGLQGYIKGNLATETAPNAHLNAFKKFISDDLANTRNAFYAGDTVKVTYEIAMPSGPFVLGYAVDASWAKPINLPVLDPMTDFPPEANCPEAWKIKFVSAEAIGSGMTNCGGQAKLTFDIYDWQGVDNVHLPRIECCELFNGEVEAIWKADGPGFSRYEAVVENIKLAPKGKYLFLISKEAKENDPVGKPWLDLRAFEVFYITVVKEQYYKPVAEAEANQENALIGEEILFDASGSHDNDCGGLQIVKYEWDWENDGEFVEGPAITLHAWDSKGVFEVQLLVTDDEGKKDMLDQPLVVTISEQEFNPVDLTPPWLNFSPQGICIEGDRLYVAGAEAGLHIFDMTDPANLIWKGWVDTYFAAAVDVVGDYAYIADKSKGLLIIDVSQPVFAHVVKTVSGCHSSNDIVVSNGYAYVTNNHNNLKIVDVDPPESASVVKTVDMPTGHYSRLAVEEGYAYVVDYGILQIVDIDPFEEASVVNTIAMPGEPRDVTVSDGYAFIADYNSRMQIVDIDPFDEASIVCTIATPGNAVGVSVSGEYAYVSCGFDGLQIINISTPELAYSVQTVPMPGDARGVAVSGDYAYVADAAAGIPIVNIAPPESAFIAAIKDTTWMTQSVEVVGDYAIVAAREAGIEIIDVQPPESAWIVRSVDTPGWAKSVAVSGGYAYVADNHAGLQIIDVNPPDMAHIVETIETPSATGDVAVSGGFAYVTIEDGFLIIDVDPIGSAHIVKELEMTFFYYGPGPVAVSGGYAYVASKDSLQVVDIEPPEDAFVAHIVPLQYNAYPQDIAISGDYAYVGTDGQGMVIVDISTPESAYILNTIVIAYARGIALSGGYAYVASPWDLQIIDIEPPESAFIVLSVPDSDTHAIAISGKYAYLAAYHDSWGPPGGFQIVKLW